MNCTQCAGYGLKHTRLANCQTSTVPCDKCHGTGSEPGSFSHGLRNGLAFAVVLWVAGIALFVALT